MAAVPPPAPGAKSRTARGTTGATGAAGGDAAASDCADAALAAAAGACGAATSSSSVSESGAPGAGGCRLLLLPLLLPPCLTMHSWSCCPRSRPQPLQHVRHGLPFCCWPGAQARPHCLLHAILWRRDVWDALTRGRPGSRVLAKVLTPTHLAFGTRSPLHPHQVCRGEGNQRIRTFLPAAQSQLRGKTRAGLALSKRVLRTRPLPGFTRPVARGKMGYTDCQNEILKRVEQ